MIVDCIQGHCTMTADGSKSFVLLLASLLRRIRAPSKACWDMSNSRARHLARRLLEFCHDGLDDVIMRQVTPHVSALYSYPGGVLEGLVAGYLTGRLATGQAEVLTPLICQFYRKWHVGQQTMAETVRFIHTHFPVLHQTVSGLPIGRSFVQEGLLLDCDWTVFFETREKEPIRLLVFNESEFSINNAAYVFENCIYNGQAMGRRLCTQVEELDVTVLLSPVTCPDALLQWAAQKRLCVAECVDPPLLDLLSQLAQSEAAAVGRVATVTSVSRAVSGGRRLACVGLTPTRPQNNREHLLHPHTLLLCGPGPGPLDQYRSACQGVFTMLHSVCEAEHTLTPMDRSQNSHTDQSEEMSHNPVQLHSPVESETTVPDPATSHDPLCWLLRAGHVLPVGGVFEMLLHHFLMSSDWSAREPEACSVLAESVLDLPRMLHSGKPRLFMQSHASLLDKLRSGTSHRTHSGGLEGVSCKQQLLLSVLQCAYKLLSIDHVLHTHTPVSTLLDSTKTTQQDEDDGD